MTPSIPKYLAWLGSVTLLFLVVSVLGGCDQKPEAGKSTPPGDQGTATVAVDASEVFLSVYVYAMTLQDPKAPDFEGTRAKSLAEASSYYKLKSEKTAELFSRGKPPSPPNQADITSILIKTGYMPSVSKDQMFPKASPSFERVVQEVRAFRGKSGMPAGGSSPGSESALSPAFQGKPLSAWLAGLKRGETAAAKALSRSGSAGVDALGQALEDPDQAVRALAAAGLRLAGPAAAKFIPQLIVRLQDESGLVRGVAAEAFRTIGSEGQKAVPALTVALKDPSGPVRTSAAITLGEMGASAKPAVPGLAALLDDRDPVVVIAAATALRDLGDVADSASDRLVKAVLTGESTVVGYALDAIEAMGKPGIPALIQIRKSTADEHVRGRAGDAMFRIRLVGQLSADAKSVKTDGISGLASFGPRAGVAAPRLVQVLKDKDIEVAGLAGIALEKIGLEAVPACVNALGEIEARAGAVHVLAKIGSDAVPYLKYALLSWNELVRIAACDALGLIGPGARAAVPELIELLEADDALLFILRRAAVVALGRIGPDAREAIPALEKLLRESFDDQRRVALRRLGIDESLIGSGSDDPLRGSFDKLHLAATDALLGIRGKPRDK